MNYIYILGKKLTVLKQIKNLKKISIRSNKNEKNLNSKFIPFNGNCIKNRKNKMKNKSIDLELSHKKNNNKNFMKIVYQKDKNDNNKCRFSVKINTKEKIIK